MNGFPINSGEGGAFALAVGVGLGVVEGVGLVLAPTAAGGFVVTVGATVDAEVPVSTFEFAD